MAHLTFLGTYLPLVRDLSEEEQEDNWLEGEDAPPDDSDK